MNTEAQLPGTDEATRSHGLEMLSEFRALAGRNYAAQRNYDAGSGNHSNVSMLSPYIRRRMITEAEVIRSVIGAHGVATTTKFVEEVAWRGYFKGWLEMRPSIWQEYRAGLAQDRKHLKADTELLRRVQDAESGQTGLECFDAWARELVETGYLHNHARMWFASIWMFTFGLPWRLGVDFFFRHLLDGDPASNTLSWRWVAGLHTRGKSYQAKAWNISRFTNERFAPEQEKLSGKVSSLVHLEPGGLPAIQPLRVPIVPDPLAKTALLITEEDCCLDALGVEEFDVRATAVMHASHLRSDFPIALSVTQFEASALCDASTRLGGASSALEGRHPAALADWAERAGARQIVTAFIPVGPLRDWIQSQAPELAARDIALCEIQRTWDQAIWPHAKTSFFKVKAQLPKILMSQKLL